MENRKKHPRATIDGAIIRIFDLESAKIFGIVENLTNGGLLLKSEEPIVIGKDYRISMSLPTLINEKSVIRCRARSLWGDEAENLWENEKGKPVQYWTGFELLDLTAGDIATLDQLIVQYSNSTI